MLLRTLRLFLIGLFSLVTSSVLVNAASFSTDFNSGLPPGTTLGGTGPASIKPDGGVGNSGRLELVYPIPNVGISGSFTVPDFAGGVAITNFRAKFKLLIGNGTDRPADGFSVSLANGIAGQAGGENGAGNGLILSFDNWDNNDSGEPGDTAPAIEVRWAGTTVAFQSMDGIRANGAAPAGPVLTNGAGGLVSIETVPPVSAGIPPTNYVDVVIELFSDNTVSLSFSNVVVFNHLPTPYVPISGGDWLFSARTGGANEDVWLDNLEILANYVPGPVSIVQSPQNQTVTESQTATFSVAANGTPPFGYQWYSNNVAIAGATFPSYTTPATTVAMNGTLYHVVVSGGEGSPVTSEDATLTVNAGVLVQTVSSRLATNHVYVTYSKPVNLNGTYTLDNGGIVSGMAYGSSHSEVVLNTSALVSGTTYTLTITGVTGEDASGLIPNPTVKTFSQGIGGICTDFAGPLPANTVLKGGAAINADGSLHLTEAVAGAGGGIVYSGYDPNATIDRVHATFNAQIGLLGNIGAGADGFSFNIAGDLPPNETGLCDPYCAESGVGTGFTVTINTWDDGSLTDPSMDVVWHGQRVGHRYFDRPHGEQLERDHFVPVSIDLTPDGKVNVSYDSIAVFTDLQLPNFDQIRNPKLGVYGRTGGAFENHYIDDLCVSHNYTLGPLIIVSQPADVTVTETYLATFQVVMDGSPPYNVQWYSNGVAIAGATGLTYTTPPTVAAMSGTLYHATIDNGQGSVTTRDALLTVNPGVILVSASSRNSSDKVYVTFSKGVSLSGNYSLNNGASIASKAYGASHSEVVLNLTAPLVRDTSYTLTVSGETGEDASQLAPDPSTATFRFGYGTFCTDFSSVADFGRPDGTLVLGAAYVTNHVLHLTDPLGSLSAGFVISNRTDGLPLDRLYANWRMLINNPSGAQPADGVSFNWGPAASVSGCCASEEGFSSGLAVIFDTYPNDATQPRFAIKWNGVQLATSGPLGNLFFLSPGTFVDVAVSVDPDGTVDVWWNGVQRFSNVQIPGFAPIANSAFSFGARTGGANENAWIDDLCINNFTPGPLQFVVTPVDTTVVEGLPVTFTSLVDGTPQYHYQWFSNNVAIGGATFANYTIAATTVAMSGSKYHVQVSNDFSVVTSADATLTVTANPRLVSVLPCAPNQVHIFYSQNVDVNSGGYDFNGVTFEATRDYGASHKEVVVIVDPPLVEDTIYQLTISDLTDEAGSLPIYPNPAVTTFRYGYSRINTDFTMPDVLTPNSPIGNNMTIYGNAYVSNGVVHITDQANNQNGSLVVTNIDNGAFVDRFVVRYKASLTLGAGNGTPADGYSLNIGQNLPTSGSEDGGGNGLTVAFDNFDNGGGEAPSIDIRYGGALLRTTTNATFPLTFRSQTDIANITRTAVGAFKDVYVDLEPNGNVTVIYNGVTIYNQFPTPFRGFNNAQLAFYGRTGGLNENMWIDNLQINNESLGAPVIISQPADVTVNELGTATFGVDVDGLPAFSYQWYSNNVAVAGATSSSYTTPSVDRRADGSLFHVVVTGPCGTVTSRDAVLHINRDNTPPGVLWAGSDQSYSSVVVAFNEALDVTSAQTTGNYAVNNGVNVTAAAIIPGTGNQYVRLTLSGTLNPLNCNIVTVSGVKDLVGYNTIATTRVAIGLKAPLQTSGANNLVVIEAEDYDANRSPGVLSPNNRWVFRNTIPGYVGSGYMRTDPDIGVNIGSTASTIPAASSLDYYVNFAAAGTYYVWVRGATPINDGSDNSVHIDVDNVNQGANAQAIGNQINNWGADAGNTSRFGWVNQVVNLTTRATINIATPGVHLITLAFREDGLNLDRFLLTTDVNFSPGAVNDPGPAATVRANLQNLAIAHGAGSGATISWSGNGWTLQGTAQLNNNPAANTWVDITTGSPLVIPDGFFGPGQTNVFFRLICK